jgi:retinol-binding protein 3
MVSLFAPQARILAAQQPLLLTPEDQGRIIANIRNLLEKYYLFPEAGREIGAYLQRNFDEHKYEKITAARRFARQITADLQQTNNDKHLSLVYDPQRVKELRAGESRPSDAELRETAQKRPAKRRRENFGFRKLELLEGNIGYLDLRSFAGTDDASSTALGAMNFLSRRRKDGRRGSSDDADGR